jgi:hypothetical protein
MMVGQKLASWLKQSLWLFIFICLLSEQVQLVSPFQRCSAFDEISQRRESSFSSPDLNPVADFDDCSDLLRTAVSDIVLAHESSRPLQFSQLWLQGPASGVALPHLSRPPPALFSV